MKSTLTTAFLTVLLAVAGPAFGQASSTPAHAPIVIASRLDVTRATIVVAIEGRPYACVLDTGTSTMLVSQSVAAATGLSAAAPVDEVAPDGVHYADRHTQLARLDVAGYAMRDVPALISSKLSGNTVLCGYDFFARIPTLIDRDRQVVTLFPTTATLDRMRCVPVDLSAHVPVASLQLDGAWIDDVVLDSGMVGGGAIWNGAAQQLGRPLATAAGYRPDPRELQNGLACGRTAIVGLFAGAPLDVVSLCTSAQRPDGYNGVIQTNFPTVHQLAIDYPNRRLCFTAGPPSPALLTTSPSLDRDAWSRFDRAHPPR
ncbi:MAG TPA: retroviral-like aspartic protease family protein [Candidatus Tumulicola sp.]